jgi:hypothetical protein
MSAAAPKLKPADDPHHESIVAQIHALKTMPIAELKAKWRSLFHTEAPPHNRRYLESRLTYRIQELIYGGLKPETVRYLEQLGEELDGGRIEVRKRSAILHGRSSRSSSTAPRRLRNWGNSASPTRHGL